MHLAHFNFYIPKKNLYNKHGKGLQGCGVGYCFSFNGMEKDNEVKGDGKQYTTLHRIYDPCLGRWLSIDPETKEFPDETPYNNNQNNPIVNTDPNGDCPWCITALVGGLVGAAVEVSGQIASNLADKAINSKSDKSWYDIDYADVGIAAGEGAIIGLTGGLGATGKLGKTAIRVINISTKVTAATGQGLVDVKTDEFGGSTNVFNGTKSKKDAIADGTMNLIGAAFGGRAPSGSKKIKGGIIPDAKTPKVALKDARIKGPVNTNQRVKIETKAKVKQKAVNIVNETIKKAPSDVPGATLENIASDRAKK